MGREGGGIALSIKEQTDFEELPLRNSHGWVDSLWAKADYTNKRHFVVKIYYRPPDRGETVDKVFFLQLQEASCAHYIILMGDFNHLNVSWKSYKSGCEQTRRFPECIEDKFLAKEFRQTNQRRNVTSPGAH